MVTDSLGFTGTQKGMTANQEGSFRVVIMDLIGSGIYKGPTLWFHHGDCVGADEDAHDIVSRVYGIKTVIHPCNSSSKRAYCKGDIIHEAKAPLERNMDIVMACGILIATPKGMEEETRSGTWTTVRYAKRKKKPYIVVYPNGHVYSVIRQRQH